MKKCVTSHKAGADIAPAPARRTPKVASLAERIARLAWMECADGATRRDLAIRATVGKPPTSEDET
jgi:hypothetical protein